jgi:hypothetical protein
VTADGDEVEVCCRLHDYGAPQRRFDRIEPRLAERGILRTGTIGASTIRAVKAMPMLEMVFSEIQRDEHYLTVEASS